MGKPSAPKPPDPKETAAAQTSSNIGTAITQQQLNNMNQVTPHGSLTYNQTGTYKYTDPNSGKTYDVPTYTATQKLSDAQQAIFDQGNKAKLNMATLGADQSARLNSMLGRTMDLNSLPERGDPNSIRQTDLRRVGDGPALQTQLKDVGPIQRQIAGAGPVRRSYGTDFSSDRARVEGALMQRMQPGLDRDRASLESRLASQGIRVGSEAYQAAMGDLGRKENDARMSAVLAGGQEQSRMTGLEARRAGFENAAQAQQFGQNASSAQFANAAQNQAYGQELGRANFANTALNQMFRNKLAGAAADNQSSLQEANADASRLDAVNNARNQALKEQFALRNQPINEITALMSGGQVKGPQFVNTKTAQIANTDHAGIINNHYNQQMANYQAKMNAWNGMWGGVMGLGANILSDRDAKTDIDKIGKTNDGQPIYSYRYKHGGPKHIGLMAQDVEKKRPDAVARIHGLRMVNYDKALEGSK